MGNHKIRDEMSSKPYIAFFEVGKDENKIVESKMPKPLEEYFPKKKTVKILVRQHDKTLKLRKMQRKVAKLQSKLVKPKYSRSEYFGLTNLDCNLATFRCIFLSFSVLSCCRTRILTVFFFGKYSSNGFGIFDSTILFSSLPTSKNAMYGFELISSLILCPC